MNEQKILAINVALRPHSNLKLFPVGLAYVLSSVKRAGYEFELFDMDRLRPSEEEIQKKLAEKKWDVVLMGCIITGYPIVKKLVCEIRKTNKSAKIIVGNSVSSSIPDTFMANIDADIGVVGEGDATIVELLDCLTQGKDLSTVKGIFYKSGNTLVKNEQRPVIADIDSIERVDFSLFDMETYIESHRQMVTKIVPSGTESVRAFPVNTARGCINSCTFCYHNFIGTKYRYRSARKIVDEIKFLNAKYGINFALLWDDLTFFSKPQLEDFVDLLLEEKLDIKWTAAVRGNLFQDEGDKSLLLRVKESGCLQLGYSLESANPEILKAMRKNMSLDEFRAQKNLLDEMGVATATSIVLGYPQETPETIAETFQFCLDVKVFPSTGYLLPQPGTPIYVWAKDNGYIGDENEYLMNMGDRQDFRINLTKMSSEEFEETVFSWLKKLNKEMGLNLDEALLIKTQYKQIQKPTE